MSTTHLTEQNRRKHVGHSFLVLYQGEQVKFNQNKRKKNVLDQFVRHHRNSLRSRGVDLDDTGYNQANPGRACSRNMSYNSRFSVHPDSARLCSGR